MIKLPKFGKFSLDDLKKVSSGLVDSVTSGDVLGRLKSESREVLPDELKAKLEAMEAKFAALSDAQKQLNTALDELKKAINEFGRDAITMYTPLPAEPKPAAESQKEEPVPQKPAEKATEEASSPSPPAEEKTEEKKEE